MSRARDAARVVLAVIVGWFARFTARRAGAIVVYHRVGGDVSGNPGLEILPTVSSGDFARQLRHLRRRYRVVPASDILDAVAQRRRGARFPVAITFDDDLESHVSDALPALSGAGLHATFFLGGSTLDGPRSFWWADLQRAVDGRLVDRDGLPYVPASDLGAALERAPKAIFRVAAAIEQLDRSQQREVAEALRAAVGPPTEAGLRADGVRGLADGGCAIGFHTIDHEPLPTLSDGDLARAVSQGRERLADAAGHPVDLIAYPHGKADERVAAAAREAGFQRGYITGRRTVTTDADPLLLPRVTPPAAPGKLALRLARAFAST
jgi:peptidoglycan/xylan/chitin deacetylase (PgdA/CDA1 family)